VIVKNLPAVIFAALTSATAASAQTAIVPGTAPPPSAFGPDPIIQITTTFRARIEGVADPRDVPSTTAQDTARRLLYNMAANECNVLAEYWKAECRLNSLAVVSSLEMIGGLDVPQVPSMFGTAIYELKLNSARR
jgi:hypothetical protein